MKYIKPEIKVTDILALEIASTDNSWLEDTDYEGAEDSITDSFLNFSW